MLHGSYSIPVGLYCHNIPTCTPQSGYQGVTKVTKKCDIAKLAENCRKCISARPTPPTQTVWSWNPNFFGPKWKKNKRFVIFDPPKKRGLIFSTSVEQHMPVFETLLALSTPMKHCH